MHFQQTYDEFPFLHFKSNRLSPHECIFKQQKKNNKKEKIIHYNHHRLSAFLTVITFKLLCIYHTQRKKKKKKNEIHFLQWTENWVLYWHEKLPSIHQSHREFQLRNIIIYKKSSLILRIIVPGFIIHFFLCNLICEKLNYSWSFSWKIWEVTVHQFVMNNFWLIESD